MKNNDYLSEYLTSECTNIIPIYIIHLYYIYNTCS